MSAVTTRSQAGEPAAQAPRRGTALLRWLAVPAGLAVAWLLPAATHRIGADWLLPLAVWVLTASLLRNGRTVLDRLVLAGGLLVGATVAAGLLMSVWPWGMRPVPVASTALTVLVLLALLLRRWPSLPLAPHGSDLVAVGSGVLAATLLALPFRGANFSERLSLMVPGEDMARHFSLYDAIGGVDGYAFLHRERTIPYVLEGLQTYPQGSHLLYQLLDTFLRSGRPASDPLNAWDHYIGFHVLGYAMLAVAVVWGVRWVAGPALTGWPKVAVYTFAIAAVSFSELIATFIRGYPSEILGLTLFAVLLALLARPARHTRELIVTVAALIVGIGWVYFLLLPLAGVAAVASLIGYRHRLMAHWVTALVAALVAVPLALTPYLVMYAEREGPLADLLPGGPVEGVDRGLTVAIAALLLAGLATVPRSPVWRTVGVQVVLIGAISAALGVYQIVVVGQLSYYFDKAVHALFVACLVGLSAATPLLAKVRHRRPAGAPAGSGTAGSARAAGAGDAGDAGDAGTAGRRLQDFAVASLVIFGIFASFGGVPLQRPSAEGVEPIRNVSWGTAYAVGNLRNHGVGHVVGAVLERYPEPDGRVTQILYTNPDASYLCTLFLSVLHRNYGALAQAAATGGPLIHVDGPGVTVLDFRQPRRIVVVNDPDGAERLRGVLDSRPDLDVELVSMQLPYRV